MSQINPPGPRSFISRLFGTAPKTSPQEAALRQFQEQGDQERRDRHPDQALAVYREGLEYARSNGLQQGQEVFLGLIGAILTEQRGYDEAEAAFNEAYELASRSGQPFRQARAQLNLGAYNLKRGDLTKAQSLLEEALDLARKSSDLLTIGPALGNLADVYMKQGNPGYALRLLKEAAPQIMQQSHQASYLIGRMGQAHTALGETDKGRKFLMQAIRLAEQHQQYEQMLMWTSSLADVAFKEGQIQEAIALYQKSEELASQALNVPDEYVPLRNLANRASALQRLGQNDDALNMVNRALEKARADKDLHTEAMIQMTHGYVCQSLGKADEATRAFEEALAIFAGEKDAGTRNDREKINAMIALGSLYQERDQLQKALEVFNEALEMAGPDDRAGRANTLRRIGQALQKQGQLQPALEKWTEALSLYELSGDHVQVARLLCDTAAVRRSLSGINAALQDYERATVLLNHVKDANVRGLVLSNVANVYTDRGEIETAKAFYDESLELARQAGNRRAEALRLGNYAWFHVVTGRPREALPMLESAMAISRELGDLTMQAVQTNNLGQAYHELKDYIRAEALYQQAIELADRLPDPKWRAVARANLAKTLLAQDQVAKAMTLLEEALPISRKVGDQEAVVRALTRLGDGYLRQAMIDKADVVSSEAETIARKWGYRKGHADAMVVRAGVLKARGDNDGSTRYLQEAKRLYQILHDPLAADLARALGET